MSCHFNDLVHNSAFVDWAYCPGEETVLECAALVCMMWQYGLEGRGKNSPCWVKELCHGNDGRWPRGAAGAFCSRLVSLCKEGLWWERISQITSDSLAGLEYWITFCDVSGQWTSSSRACSVCHRECMLLQHQGQVPSYCHREEIYLRCFSKRSK